MRGCSQHPSHPQALSRCQACRLVGEGLTKASCPSWHRSGSMVGTPAHISFLGQQQCPNSAPQQDSLLTSDQLSNCHRSQVPKGPKRHPPTPAACRAGNLPAVEEAGFAAPGP